MKEKTHYGTVKIEWDKLGHTTIKTECGEKAKQSNVITDVPEIREKATCVKCEPNQKNR